MTRDDDRDWISPVRESDGAGGGPIAQLLGDGAVAGRGAVGDLAQGVPHAVFERRAEGFERQIECGAGAGEVLLELLARAREQCGSRSFGGFHPPCLVRRRGSATRGWEKDAGDGRVGGGEDELADGGAEAGEGERHAWIIITRNAESRCIVVRDTILRRIDVADHTGYGRLVWHRPVDRA